MSLGRANGRDAALAGKLLRVHPRMALRGHQVMLDREGDSSEQS